MPTWASSRSTGHRSFRRVGSRLGDAPPRPYRYRDGREANGDPATARLFNSSPIQPRKCRILLTKIALLLYTGEKFPTNEATSLFFGISKLFQNKDASLRQMVHLAIKELANSAEDIIMVTSTIMKDTGGSAEAIYRPNAIRALCRIIDVSAGLHIAPALSPWSWVSVPTRANRASSSRRPYNRSSV